MKQATILYALLFVLSVQLSWGEIPETISYQGLLTTSGGASVAEGNYNLMFVLYDSETNGSAVWTETHFGVPVTDGVFNVILGSVTSLSSVEFDQQYWLGVTLGAGPEMTPRTKLTASAYSLNSRSVADGAVTEDKIAANAVTSGKIAGSAVTTLHILNGTIAAEDVGFNYAGSTSPAGPATDLVSSGAVDTTDLANDAVIGDKIADGQVVRSVNGKTDDVTLAEGTNITITPGDNTLTISAAFSGWSLTGNAGTNPTANFLGTTDDQPLEFRVNDERALRLEPHATSPNVIGGFSGNWIADGVYGATISGGGKSGYLNSVTGNFGAVGEGQSNTASGGQATIGGGHSNEASGEYATVAGGLSNTASGGEATIGGGYSNEASNFFATVGGGYGNEASSDYATVAGGLGNTASDQSATVSGGHSNEAIKGYATVGGGFDNTASGQYATVAGGGENTASHQNATVSGGGSNTANGYHTTVSGGYNNTASDNYATVSGGNGNIANVGYSTVGGGFENRASDHATTVGGGQFNTASTIKATVGGGQSNIASGSSATIGGGYSNQASGDYATVPGGRGNKAMGDYSFAAGRNAKADEHGSFIFADRTNTGPAIFNAAWPGNDFSVLCTGGARFATVWNSQTGAITGGMRLYSGGSAWASMSDRNVKDNFTKVDGRDILKNLVSIPIETWNYKAQDPSIRHIGPMAQDFYAAFGMGEDDRYISTIDADGVALAAIQGLYELVEEKDAKIAELEARLAALEALVSSEKASGTGQR